MKIDIVDIAYNDLSTLRLYKGNNLIWERKNNFPPIDYYEYDMVLDWNSRIYNTSSPSLMSSNYYYSTESNARTATSLCLRQGTNVRYNLTNYQEEEPSYITKFNFSDLINRDIISLASAFQPFGYASGGIPRTTTNPYLTEVKWAKIPSTCTNLSNMFNTCTALKSAILCGDVSNVITYSSMFYGCTNLETITFIGWKMQSSANVTAMIPSTVKKIYLKDCDETTESIIKSVKGASTDIEIM